MTTSVGSSTPGLTAHETLVARGATLVPSTPTERADLLDGSEWSRHIRWPDLVCFAQRLSRYRLGEGTVLFQEGDHDVFLAIVVRGLLEIRKHDLAGRDRMVA